MSDTTAATPHSSSGEVEDALLAMIREMLHNDSIGPEDDFFLAGGHSLLGTQLVIRARKAFGVKVTLNDLFEAGTVARLAAHIEAMILEEIASLSDEEAAHATR